MVTVGVMFTAMLTIALSAHPPAVLPYTVYVVLTKGVAVILAPVEGFKLVAGTHV